MRAMAKVEMDGDQDLDRWIAAQASNNIVWIKNLLRE
jgi:hypothetical protein